MPSPGGPSGPGQNPPGTQTPGSQKTPKGKEDLYPVPYGQIQWKFVWPKPRPIVTGSKPEKTSNPFELIPEMTKARDDYSPVIFFIYTSDKRNLCAKACHKLNTTVFVDQGVVKESKHFLCLATDLVHMHNSVRIQFKIKIVPTVIITDCFSTVLYTLRGPYTTPKAFQRFMDNARRRNEKAVIAYKARLETLQREFRKADELLDAAKFDEAEAILDRMAKNRLDPAVAEGAAARLEEMKMGRLFAEGVKALEAKDFDQARVKLASVADSPVSNRWGAQAWELVKSIPAAKLYFEALSDIENGENYEAMQKLQKVAGMDGPWAKKAADKIEEMKRSWREKVK